MTELAPELESTTAIDTQQLHEQKPDVARARQSKRTRLSDHDNGGPKQERLHTPRHVYDPDTFCIMNPPAERRPKSKRWTQQEIQSVILRVLEAPFLEASIFHHSASVKGNTIIIPGVPFYVFETIRECLALDCYARIWKLEIRRTSSSRGCLIMTVPSSIHMAFRTFTYDIEKQMQTMDFASIQEVYQMGRTSIKSSSGTLTPDASISILTPQNRFLILEVAHSRREKDALRNARTYLLNVHHDIKIVLVVVVNKKPTPRGRSNDADILSAETDTVHVHVCKYMPDTLGFNVKSLQIFPGPLPEDTFEITWSDVNTASWSKNVESMGMTPETPEPVCHINFHSLYWTAMMLAGQFEDHLYRPPKFGSDEEGRLPLKKWKYLPDS